MAQTINGNNSVCAAEQDVVYSISLVAGRTYNWSVTGGTIDGSSTGNSILVDWGAAGPGTLQVTETITATGCAVTTPIYNITINNTPTPSISGLATVCANTTGVVYSTPNVVGDIYSWTVVGGSITAGGGTNSITVDWGGAGAGSVTLTEFIIGSGCTVTTNPYAVTINAIPTPSITGDNTVCANVQDKTYTTPLVGGHTYSWTVTGGTIDGSSTGNSILVDWGVAGPGTIQLTETITASGCLITTPIFSVNINNIPTPVISGLNAVCANDAGVVYSTPNVPGNSYSWSVTGGTVASGAGTNSITVNWGPAGSGSITLTELIPSSSCVTVTAPYNVTINSTPTPVIAGDNSVCESDQDKVYTSTFTPGNTYSWSVTGGTIDGSSTSNNVTVDWGVAGPGTLSLTETVGGCSTTSAIFNVTINPNPTPVITGSNSVCRSQTGITYSTPPAAGRAYSWTVIGGTIDSGAGTNSISVTWTSAGTGSVIVSETISASGCNITTAPFVVSVAPNPVVSAGSDEEICSGLPFNFTSQSTPATATDFASLLWTTTGTGVLSNATTLTPGYTPGVGEVGPVTFTLTGDGMGACPDAVDQMILNITPLPVVNAGSDSETCAGILFNFTTQVTPASASNYSTISWSHTGTGTLFNPNTIAPTYLPGVGETGSVTFTLQANSTGSCSSVTDAMQLSITPAPTVNAGGDAEICQGLAFNFATQSPAASATNFLSILWTTSGSGSIASANTLTPIYTPGVGETGNVTFTLTATGNGSCVSIQDAMTLSITPSPSTTAGSDEEICEGSTFNFSTQSTLATASNYNSITWTTTGTGTLFNANTLTPTYFPLAGETGNITFTLTAVGNGSCVNVNDQMTLTITPSPTVTAGSDAETCQGVSYNFSTQVTPANATNYASIVWSTTGTGVLTNPNTLTPSYAPGVGETGNVTFTLTATGNGSCATLNDQMTLTITPSPTVAAGSDAETCQGITYNFSTQVTPANATNYTSILWSTPGTGTLTNANTFAPTYTPGVGETGNVIFTLTVVGNGSCVSVNDQMTLAITPSPTVSAGSDAETCQGITYNFSTQVTPATAANYASITWTTTGTGILTNANTLTPSYAPGAGETGNVIFTLTANGNGSCSSVNDQMILSITPSPVVAAGSDAETCQGVSYNFSTQSTLASGANYASLLWTHSGTGTIFNATTLTPTYAPGVGETGNVTFTLTAVGNGSCASVNDQMTLAITPSPTIVAGSDEETCQGISYNFSAQGTAASGANYASLLWTHSGTGTIFNANTLSPTYAPGVGETGNVLFTLTATGNGSCASVNDQMVLVVTPAPIVTAGSDSETCQGISFNFSAQATPATASNYASLLWTHSGTGTIFNSNTLTPTYLPGVGEAGNVTFTLTALGNGSCSSVNDQVILAITPSPTITAGSDAETCQGVSFNFSTQSTAATGTNYAGVLWTTAGTGVLSNANTLTPSYAPGAGETGNVIFTLTATGNGSCASVNDQMTLTITPSPTVSAGSDSETCQGINFNFSGQAILASASNFNSILWTTTGTGLLSNANTLTPTYSPGVGETGNVTFTLTATGNGSCASVNDQMTLVITPSPTVAAGSDAETCQSVSINFATRGTLASATNQSSLLWTTTGSGTLTNATTLSPTYTPGIGETGNIVFTLTAMGNGSCVSVNDQMTLTITPSPTVTAGSDGETCQGINYNFSTQVTPSSATNYLAVLWTTTGTGTIFNATTFTPTYQPGIGEAGNVTFTLTATGNGSCASVNDQMTLVITPSPVVSAGSDAETCQGISYNFSTQTTLASASNFSGLLWTHTGSGSISGQTSLTPTYTPGVGETGLVTFTLTASGNGSCAAVNDAMVLTITPSVTVDAGSDEEICQGGVFNFGTQSVPASASNFNSLVWTHNGAGTLFNTNTLAPTYFASASETGLVTFTLTAIGNGSCVNLNNTMSLTITPAPVAIAGSDDAVCEGTPIFNFTSRSTIASSLNGSVFWTHNGTGTLDDPTNINPNYTVGVGDVNTTITFTLTITSPSAVCPIDQDQFDLDVNRAAIVSVPSTSIVVCEPAFIDLAGSISGSAVSGAWSLITGGGTLSISSIDALNVVRARYDTVSADVGTMLVFRLTSNDPDGAGPCTPAFIDMDVTIDESAKVFAGPDFAVCEYDDIDLNGSFSGATSSVTWSGGSGGAFGNISSPITSYDMTPAERAASGLIITFTLTTDNPSGVCNSVSDQVKVTVNDTLNFVTFSALDPIYQEDDPSSFLIGVPNTPIGAGIFTGPGIVAGTNEFIPDNANLGVNYITYSYTDPATGCVSSPKKATIVNPITTISFDVYITPTMQVPEILGVPQVCATIRPGDVLLKGTPDVLDPGASIITPPFFTISPDVAPSYIFQKIDGQFYINTKNLPPGNYIVTYFYTNQFEAQSQFAKNIKVLAAPKAIIDAGNSCVTSAVFFPESSYIPVNNGAIINQWFWNFDDGGATSTAQEPSHLYSVDNAYDITLEVTTNEGCKHDTLKTIVVGPVPGVNFTWSEFCNGNDTKFVDTTNPGIIVQYTWEFADGFTVSGPAGGTIPGGTNGGRTSGTYNNPQHRYDLFGQKDVKLSVLTDVGCLNDTTRRVSILSYTTPSPISSYFEDFEASQGSWFSSVANQFGVPTLPTDTSWVWGAPGGATISTASSGVNAWWTGSNPNFAVTNSTYYNNENSAVLGPCVNLMNVKRPMMSIDYWSDAEDNFDGAVIQYSVDGGSSWQTLGNDAGAGINWYNGRALTGNPGEQLIGQFGWSDRQGAWKNARYNLDQIPIAERNEVIFRVAFASNDDNDVTTQTFNGFAFDNVFIGDKQRGVLVEYFTNAGLSSTTNDYLNNLYDEQESLLGKDSSDFVKIQYHIANPSADVINQDNPIDPATRSNYYGLSQPPVGIMDGILGNYYGTNFNGDQTKIDAIEVDRRALEDPLFDIQVAELASTADSIKLDVSFEYIALPTHTDPVTFYVGLVDGNVSGNLNVLRKMLLGGEGITVNTTWNTNDATTVPVKSIIDVPIGTANNNLWIVAFVQDRNTKWIHQTEFVKLSVPKDEAVVVGVEDPVLSGAKSIQIYPNPASNQLNFASEYRLMEGYTYSIVDQRGITVLEGDLKEDIFNPQQVELDKVTNGIYFVIISRGGRALVHRKIAVMNRN
ncbi:MAG: PKD domain-containing protein [Cyclobacteriaceae bacterium]